MYSGPAARGGCLSTRLKERERERKKSEITRGRGEKNAITHNHIGFLTYFLVLGVFRVDLRPFSPPLCTATRKVVERREREG